MVESGKTIIASGSGALSTAPFNSGGNRLTMAANESEAVSTAATRGAVSRALAGLGGKVLGGGLTTGAGAGAATGAGDSALPMNFLNSLNMQAESFAMMA